MRYRGSNLVAHEDKNLIRIRNHPDTFLVVPQNLLDFLGDLRYAELYLDHSDTVHVKKPGGTQFPVPRPYELWVILDSAKKLVDARTVAAILPA